MGNPSVYTKTNPFCSVTHQSPSQEELDMVHDFIYPELTILDNVNMDTEINRCIGKANTTMSKLNKQIWSNQMFTMCNKIYIYIACMLSTLLYVGEIWTLYSCQEKWLDAFHMQWLRCILAITWRDCITNNRILEMAGIDSMFAMLKERHLWCLGHLSRMEDGWIPKDIFYGELYSCKRSVGRSKFCFKDIHMYDLKVVGLDT